MNELVGTIEVKDIANNITKLRKRIGMNQSEFARSLGISRTGLYLYESGKRIISTEMMLKIYEKFSFTPNEILGINRMKSFE